MTEKDFKRALAGGISFGGFIAIAIGGNIGHQNPSIWMLVLPTVLVFVVALIMFYQESVRLRQLQIDKKKADEHHLLLEEQGQLAAEAASIAAFDAAGLKLQQDQHNRILKRAVEEILDYADDLDSSADKTRLLSAMGESVSRLSDHRDQLFSSENQQLVLDLKLVLNRIDDAELSQRITAVRLRRLLAENSNLQGKLQ